MTLRTRLMINSICFPSLSSSSMEARLSRIWFLGESCQRQVMEQPKKHVLIQHMVDGRLDAPEAKDGSAVAADNVL